MHTFTLKTRISDALRQRPELRELLPAFHPAFSKLNHPVLGRIMPRLVDVEGAARVAGVDPEALLAVMNLPGGAEAPRPAPAARLSEPSPPWLAGATLRELDARPILEGGEDPFKAIMEALRALGASEVLVVLAPFEPAPLRALLGRQGWEHHVAWDGDTCRASFWLPPERSPALAEGGEVSLEGLLSEGSSGWTLDVRGLEPPRPLRATLAALDRGALPLTLLHRREPALLYPRLEARGLAWSVREVDGGFEIAIHAP
jgi:hypothetical protein